MTKQTFTTGQILTASQLTSLQQTAMGGGSTTAKTASYVLVAADAGTVVQMNSASATTITVNTALFAAGDEVNIQNVGAGVCTVTAGTATVSTAGSLALSQYEGGQLYFNTTSAALFFDIVQSALTNPMTTTGDIIYSSSGSTPARLGIGTTGQNLVVASGVPSWATPSSGMTLIKRATFTSVANTGTTFDGMFSATYDTYLMVVEDVIAVTEADDFYFQFRYAGPTTQTSANKYAQSILLFGGSQTLVSGGSAAQFSLSPNTGTATFPSTGQFYISRVGNNSEYPVITGTSLETNQQQLTTFAGFTEVARIYTGFILSSASTNITGTVAVYGLALT